MTSVVAGVRANVHTVRGIDPDDSRNMYFLFAFERTQAAPQSVCLNDTAPENIPSILVTLDTAHFEMSQLNDSAFQNMPRIFLTLDTSHFEMSTLNDVASQNMLSMLVTLDTSHFVMSPLNDSAV